MEISSRHRAGTDGQRLQRRESGAYPAKRRGKPDFLTATIAPIHAYDITTVTAGCGEVKLPALEEQAVRLSRIYGKDYKPERSGNDLKDVLTLYNDVKKLLSDKVEVELVDIDRDEGNNRQEFVTFYECDFPTSEIFFIPIRILETIDEDLRDILMDFFAFLERTSPFTLPRNSYDMEYSLGVLDSEDDSFDPEITCDWDEDYRKLAERYVKGDLSKTFAEIEAIGKQFLCDTRPLAARIRKKMSDFKNPITREYTTPHGKEYIASTLLNCIDDGLNICMEDNLFNYELRGIRYNLGDSLFYSDIDSDKMVDFDRCFLFTWGDCDEDEVMEHTLDAFNGDMGQFCETVLLDVHLVSRCDGKIEPNDYPKRWYEWYIKFLNCIYE